MQENKISLIGTSQGGREFEVERLFKSLIGTTKFLEVVFVDQSDDNKIELLVDKYKEEVNINLLSSSKISLSKARNLALKVCSGNIIGFCDDDAFYKLESLNELVKYNSGRCVICWKVIDKDTNENYGNRSYPSKPQSLSYVDVIRYCLSVGVFIYALDNSWVKKNIIFDERLGVGTALGGSEETEMLFRLMSNGINIKYTESGYVYHDNDVVGPSTLHLEDKYYKYAVGYALVIKIYLLKSRGLLGLELLRVLARSLVGLLYPSKHNVCKARLKGILKGFNLNFTRLDID